MTAETSETIQQFIRITTTAATNVALYHAEHPQVQRMNTLALKLLTEILHHQGRLVFKQIEKQLVCNNKVLPSSLATERLKSAMQHTGISFIQIDPGIYAEELLGLVLTLSRNRTAQELPEDSIHIHYGQLEVKLNSDRQQNESTALNLKELADLEVDQYADLYQRAQQHEPLDLAALQTIVSGFIENLGKQQNAFLALAPLRAMDEYTYTHSTNICLLNLAQARALGIEGQQLVDIGIAAMLHDVGKMFISPAILGKTDKLSDEEWQIMQQHPRLGAEYLLRTPGIPRLAIIAAFEHHMHYDGSGYPHTRSPWGQHLCSCMTAIADTYDAMRTRRSYEEPLPQKQIIEIMKKLAGTRLHPLLTLNFLELLQQLEQSQPRP